METHDPIIDGKTVPAASGETFDVFNPHDGSAIARVGKCGPDDADAAVRAARRAFEDGPWPRMRASERAKRLYKLAELIRANLEAIARDETRNVGKPIGDSRDEIGAGAYCFEYYAGAIPKFCGETIPVSAKGFDFTLREPIGVVAAIVPWNFPFPMACWKVAPAMAAGNCVVLKPASLTPLSAIWLAKLALQADIPPGVLNLIAGPGSTAGTALVAHPEVDKISFTGETTTGAEISKLAADGIKRISLELGGKSPNIVFADADIERAARTSVLAVFGNAGQDCCARSRVFVERSVHDAWVEAFVDETAKTAIGDPMDDATKIGPLVSMGQRARSLEYVEIGRKEGATLAYGGEALTDGPFAKGSYMRPAVFVGANNRMRVCREEIFGPVVCVIPFDDEREMLRQVNDNEFGLSGSIWTRDLNRALRTIRAVRSGVISVNCNSSVHVEAPFGGYKKSGFGRDLGMYGLANFTETKNAFIWQGDEA